MKRNVVLCAVLVFGISLLFSYAVLAQGEGDPGEELWCARTQGYWKNHPEAWPVLQLDIGVTTYTQAELLEILNAPVKGDMDVILKKQLIAAKLNVYANSSLNCYQVYGQEVGSIIYDADSYLALPAEDRDEMVGEAIKDKLDTFNNSEACWADCGGGPPPV